MHRVLLVALSLGLAWSLACARAVRPERPPVEGYAGVPLTFSAGGPDARDAEWSFDDDTPTERGRSVRHAFVDPGQYVVTATGGGKVLERFEVIVHPRPVLHAVPPTVGSAIVVPMLRDTLAPAVDFLERAFGRLAAPSAAGREPFVAYAVELSAGPPPEDLGVDLDEGLATFQFPGSDTQVTAVGISDPAVALRAAEGLLVQRGYERVDASDEWLELVSPDRRRTVLLVDRGYLYVVSTPPDREPDIEAITAIHQMPDDGLMRTDVPQLQKAIPPGVAYVYLASARPMATRAGGALSGALISLRFSGDRLDLDGVMASANPMWDASLAPEVTPLANAAARPVFAASVSLDPVNLAALLVQTRLLTPPASVLERTPDGSLRAHVDELAAALRGDVGLLAWIDAGETLERLEASEGEPDLAGTIALHAGISDRATIEAWLTETLRSSGIEPTERRAEDATAYLFEVRGRRAVAAVRADRLDVRLGPEPSGREAVPLASLLQARYGASAFSPGHISAVLDLGQIVRELESLSIRDPATLRMRAFATGFLRELTGIEILFVDIAPDPIGAGLSGQVILAAPPAR